MRIAASRLNRHLCTREMNIEDGDCFPRDEEAELQAAIAELEAEEEMLALAIADSQQEQIRANYLRDVSRHREIVEEQRCLCLMCLQNK